jgi:hypothetical protein
LRFRCVIVTAPLHDRCVTVAKTVQKGYFLNRYRYRYREPDLRGKSQSQPKSTQDFDFFEKTKKVKVTTLTFLKNPKKSK